MFNGTRSFKGFSYVSHTCALVDKCVHLSWHSTDRVECLSLVHRVSLPIWHLKAPPSHHSQEYVLLLLFRITICQSAGDGKGMSCSEHVHLIKRLYHFEDAIVNYLYLIFLFFETLRHPHNEIFS